MASQLGYNCSMHRTVVTLWAGFFAVALAVLLSGLFFFPELLLARNINEFKDTISTSAPLKAANHTLSFRLDTNVSPGGYFEVTPPSGFEMIATSTFAERNVELRVGGIRRAAGDTIGPTTDMVEIFPGSPGMVRYTLNSSTGISAGSQLELRIGNQTTAANKLTLIYSTTTMSTTTIPADVPPIINAATTGSHEVKVTVFDGGEVANAGFVIFLNEQVGVGPADTTEIIPPFRFNGAPTSTVGGTTLSVELSLETDELSICRFARTPGEEFSAMPTRFSNTGFIFHSTIVAVVPNSLQQFYVRCIDDEGNFNIDDFVIEFSVSAAPTGQANTTGSTSGDGTGSGNDGTGSGNGGGGTTGAADGEAPLEGGSSGSGGSGGGGGGGRGADGGSTAGGGFESTDDIYPSGDGRVTITGTAFPRSRVNALVDGKPAEQTTADNSGNYSITLDKIARGVYTFGLFATDPAQVKSSTFSTSFTVTGARTTALSNINIAPTIKVLPDPATSGQPVVVSGFSMPNATITIENEREGTASSRRTSSTTADANGSWSLNIDTSGFAKGTYKVRAKAAQAGGLTTNFSNYTLYGLGQSAERQNNADLSRDGKVNLTDFSILLFWWNTNGGTSDPRADINSDGRVTLTDFSIMLFNWTG